jgi:hypothetical protein
MGFFKQWRGVAAQSMATQDILAELGALLPELRELCNLRVNLSRLGPRLDTLDEVGHHVKNLDELGGRLDSLEATVRSLTDLSAVTETANTILKNFLDANHNISEDVRLDVDTMSAMILSLNKSISHLSSVLEQTQLGPSQSL